jgi:aspartyl-tRNA(Asn)/glutamyl-tRNA(Gln) amidotransferase subunit C
MPKLDRAALEHLAQLAQLSLREDEIDRLAKDLDRIVAYVDELAALDLEGVEPTAQIGAVAALRADEPLPCLAHDDALSGAPRVEEGGFSVPPFVEG